MSDKIEMGWAAPKIAEQFPQLPVAVANRLQVDSDSITHLSMRGHITRAERERILKRFARAVSDAVLDERRSGVTGKKKP